MDSAARRLRVMTLVDGVPYFDAERDKAWQLHPVQRRAAAADARVREQAVFDAKHGRFHVPARSAVVFVIE